MLGSSTRCPITLELNFEQVAGLGGTPRTQTVYKPARGVAQAPETRGTEAVRS